MASNSRPMPEIQEQTKMIINLQQQNISFQQEINKSIVYEKRKFYQLLHDVGILQTDSNKCAKFLNDLLKTKTLGSWWKSKKTQDALNLFRENICPENKNLVQDITNLMK